VNGIGKTIERVARRNRFRVIENLCGHGVGRSLHEEPQEIRGTYLAADKRILKKGQVIAIEPFLSTRSRVASETGDGWTLATDKGNLSAQFEHTIVVTGKRPILLTVA
jgi:methionyl aminopeptidase